MFILPIDLESLYYFSNHVCQLIHFLTTINEPYLKEITPAGVIFRDSYSTGTLR